MPALAIRTPEDALLGAMAPLGLAVAAPGPSLVVDLDVAGPPYLGPSSLADLVREGPRRSDLGPARTGVAVLRNGGISATEAAEVVDHIVAGWPFTILRLGGADEVAWTTVTMVPLVPLGAGRPSDGPVAYQDAGWRMSPPGPGPVLPVPRKATWAALAAGRRPVPDRWVRSLRAMWSWA